MRGGRSRRWKPFRALLRIRTAERDAHELATELREAVRIRDEFLTIAAHELKTPLTSLQLQLDSLANALENAPSAGPKSMLLGKVDTAIRQTTRLAVLVDDLLDVSSITQGRFAIHPEEADLERIVRDVVSRFSSEAARVGCALTVETPGPVAARVDRLRIEQVCENLITNALKYGCAKPVHAQLTATDSKARLIVRDGGIGIAPEDRERIFGRFERAVSANHYGGLGLGLFITHRIVEAHGGTIHVESELLQGSAFVVELPRAPIQAEGPSGKPSA
jgi:two-component system, OmpR family, sensor kinase